MNEIIPTQSSAPSGREALVSFAEEVLSGMGADQGVNVEEISKQLVIFRNPKQFYDFLDKYGIRYSRSDKYKDILLQSFTPSASMRNNLAILLLPLGGRHSVRTFVHEIQHLIDMSENKFDTSNYPDFESNFAFALTLLNYLLVPLFLIKGVFPENVAQAINFGFNSSVVIASLYWVYFLREKYNYDPAEQSAKRAEKKYSKNEEFAAALKRLRSNK